MPLGLAADQKGILPDRMIAALTKAGGILPAYEFAPDQIQPASLDLRLGDTAYRVRASFLPGHTTVAERDLVQLQMLDALRDRRAAGQEARPHAIRNVAEAQIEARGLDLVGREIIGGQNPTRVLERRDHAIRQDALLGHDSW